MRRLLAVLVLPVLVASCGGRDSTPAPSEATGAFDTSFGVSGLALAKRGASPQGWLASLAVLDDGSIVLAGESSYLAKLTPEGLPDTSFGEGGIGAIPRGPYPSQKVAQIARAPGDRLLVVEHHFGSCMFRGCEQGLGLTRVRRLEANGAVDAAYGEGGYAVTMHRAKVAVTQDGRMMTFAFAQYPMETVLVVNAIDPQGGFVPGFAPRALAAIQACGRGDALRYFVDTMDVVAVDERFVLATSFSGYVLVQDRVPYFELATQGICVLRLNADGAVDSAFGNGGQIVLGSEGYLVDRLLRERSGELVLLLKRFESTARAYRVDAEGRSAVPSTLPALRPYVADVALQQNGKFVAVGTFGQYPEPSRPVAWRSVAGGSQMDASFGSGGTLSLVVDGQQLFPSAVAIDSQDRLVVGGNVAGSGQIGIARIR